jgi:hypothetical protein
MAGIIFVKSSKIKLNKHNFSCSLFGMCGETDERNTFGTDATELDKADIHSCPAVQTGSVTHLALFPRG